MAAGSWNAYTQGVNNAEKGLIDFTAAGVHCILVTSSYTPAADTHATYSDLGGNEVAAGSGYTRGGVALTGTVTNASGTTTLSGTSPSWGSASFTAKYAVLLLTTATPPASTDKLIAFVDLSSGGGSVTAGGGTFTITLSGSGILTLTHSP